MTRRFNRYGATAKERQLGQRKPEGWKPPSKDCVGFPFCETCYEDLENFRKPQGQGHRSTGVHLSMKKLHELNDSIECWKELEKKNEPSPDDHQRPDEIGEDGSPDRPA